MTRGIQMARRPKAAAIARIAQFKASVAAMHKETGTIYNEGDLTWLDIMTEGGESLGAFITAGYGYENVEHMLIAIEMLSDIRLRKGCGIAVLTMPLGARVALSDIMRMLGPREALALRHNIWPSTTPMLH
jgi:hypothetical protein